MTYYDPFSENCATYIKQFRFHSVPGSPDERTRYFTKEGNAFPSFVWNAFWNAFGTRLKRVRNAFKARSERNWNAFGTQLERVRNAIGTRSERVMDAFRTQMERERSVRLFLSSTVPKPRREFLKKASSIAVLDAGTISHPKLRKLNQFARSKTL